MRTIAIVNQKGGVGKSTTAGALVSGLTLRGKRALVIDLDAQGNLSSTMNGESTGASILEVLKEEVPAIEAIQHTKNGDIIVSHKALSGADTILTMTGKEYRLSEALESISSKYDYVILDSPPALGILTVNALTAADSVVIPAQADIYSIQGIEQVATTIQPVKKYCNPKVRIEGILLTRYTPRAVLSKEVATLMEQLAAKLETKLFKTTIREAVAVKEAQISRKSLFEYAPKANVTEDYVRFIDELLGATSKERGKK